MVKTIRSIPLSTKYILLDLIDQSHVTLVLAALILSAPLI